MSLDALGYLVGVMSVLGPVVGLWAGWRLRGDWERMRRETLTRVRKGAKDGSWLRIVK